MAVCSSLAAVSPYVVPKLSSKLSESRARVSRSTQTRRTSELYRNLGKRRLSTRLNAAGFAEIEPDLREDPHGRWETNSISMDDLSSGSMMSTTLTTKAKRIKDCDLLLQSLLSRKLLGINSRRH